MSYIIQTRSGNEEEFKDMLNRCNKSGIRIYVDVTINHMASSKSKMVGTAGSTSDGKRSFPAVPYTPKDFHRPCTIDTYFDAHMVRNCDLDNLPDLDQSIDVVKDKIASFLNRLIDMGVAGFRIGASKHMWPNDLKVYQKFRTVNKPIYNNISIRTSMLD